MNFPMNKDSNVEFICPVCKTAGNTAKKGPELQITKKTCKKCSAILLINPENGNVDAHKAPLKDSLSLKNHSTRSTVAASSVLSSHLQNHGYKDWPAIAVLVIILSILIAAGIYFVLNLSINANSFLSVC
jgi:hypothetical protein